jgi:hypothetical protein
MPITLPLAPWQVLSGKFLLVLVAGYLSTAPFVLPGLLVYGIRSGADGRYWPQALILAVGEAAQRNLQDLLLGAPLVSWLAGTGSLATTARFGLGAGGWARSWRGRPWR